MMLKNICYLIIQEHLLERNPKERFSAIEAFNELNKIKIGVNLNKNISKTLNESPKKFEKCSNIYESSSEKKKFIAKSSFNRKFRGILKHMNNYNDNAFNKNEEDEEISDDNSFEKEKNNNKNKKKNNEIRILIKKKNK